MKKLPILAPFIILFILSCKSPRQQCYDSTCSNVEMKCNIESQIKYNPLDQLATNLTLPLAVYPTIQNKEETSDISNTIIEANTASNLSIPADISLIFRYKGAISSATDIDIYYAQLALDNKLTITMESGTANCSVYMYNSKCNSINATMCANYKSSLTLFFSPFVITSSDSTSSGPYLYIKCAGNAGDSYAIKFILTSEKPTEPYKIPTLSSNPGLKYLLDKCYLSKKNCIKQCNSALPF